MKKLFTNYNFEFDKNEKKLIATFCKQVLKQTEGDNRFFAEDRVFNSILEKLKTGNETIKFTKEERSRLQNQMQENVKHIKKEMSKAGFIKRWLYKSMLKQYDAILERHFKG
ncbi:MAG: hypothetical protein AUK34_00850 [Ignavibacteria bacterium CG2_30_36_16]|nr:hypothetical protein [Ignavibacteria bacterium]OIP63825.1 MAG: hypothetical protein AUK34_00850 [Ignavibacteria bacterium CG2_30_36_16]PJA99124.1 MAG: hypothetical protein CO127_11225 [Ignavibacteria bacterium CG_4_9_14_3_um_filter_36_18]